MHITDATVFYGPHPCARCGMPIVKSSKESGGLEFDQPGPEPVYPNTTWHTHRCRGDADAPPSPHA